MKILKFLSLFFIAAVLTVAVFQSGARTQDRVNEKEIEQLVKNTRIETVLQMQYFCEVHQSFYIDKESYVCVNVKDIKQNSTRSVPTPKEYSI